MVMLRLTVVMCSCHVDLSSDLDLSRTDEISNPRSSYMSSLSAVDTQASSELPSRDFSQHLLRPSVVVDVLHIVFHLGSLVSSSVISSPARSSLLPLISCVFIAYCSISSFVSTLNTIT